MSMRDLSKTNGRGGGNHNNYGQQRDLHSKRQDGPAKDSISRIENLFSGINALPVEPDNFTVSTEQVNNIEPVRKQDEEFHKKTSPENNLSISIEKFDSSMVENHTVSQPEINFAQIPASNKTTYPIVTIQSEGNNQTTPKLSWQSVEVANNSLSWESLMQGKPIISNSDNGQPATLAFGLPMPKSSTKHGSNSALLMEFIDENREQAWSEDELILVEQVADQLTLALDNARLFQETQNALSETEHLYQASADLNASQTYQEILAVLRRHTILGKADRLVSISLFDQPWLNELSPTWLTPLAHWTCLPAQNFQTRYLLEKFPAYQLLTPDSAGLFENIECDERLDPNVKKLFQKNFESESAVLIPLNVAGQWIGFILGSFSSPQKFEENLIRQLMALSRQAAVSIQNIRLLAESQRRANQLQTAAEIARDVSSTLALDDLFARFVNLLCERFSYYHASIFLIDDAQEYATIRESTGRAGEALKQKGHRLAIGSKSIIGQATLTGNAVVFNDLSTQEAKETHYANPLLPHTKSELGIPLKVGDRVIGALNVQSKLPDAFSNDDIAILQTLADQIAIAVDNANAYQLVQQSVEETRKADRLKSQFLANMSHELRTPLNSIIGFSRVILKGIDGPINTLQQQDLTAIYNSGQHLLGLINDVLDLSKIEAGKMELAFEDGVNLSEIVKGVMSTTVGLVKDKPITLNHTIDSSLPLLRVDPIKIRQVLLNLLSNAAKFTESGSINLEVEVIHSSSGNSEVKVSVTDTGVGIAAGDQSKLFQAFSQVDGSLTRKTGGSGLGLSICQHLIQMHNGRIGMTSEVGKGSTFYFYLPIDQYLTPDELTQSSFQE